MVLIPRDPADSEADSNVSRLAANSSYLIDRKSTRLNSSHSQISYAVFCLKKKNRVTQLDEPLEDRDDFGCHLSVDDQVPQVSLSAETDIVDLDPTQTNRFDRAHRPPRES